MCELNCTEARRQPQSRFETYAQHLLMPDSSRAPRRRPKHASLDCLAAFLDGPRRVRGRGRSSAARRERATKKVHGHCLPADMRGTRATEPPVCSACLRTVRERAPTCSTDIQRRHAADMSCSADMQRRLSAPSCSPTCPASPKGTNANSMLCATFRLFFYFQLPAGNCAC
jgi:hypothetical protein